MAPGGTRPAGLDFILEVIKSSGLAPTGAWLSLLVQRKSAKKGPRWLLALAFAVGRFVVDPMPELKVECRCLSGIA